jgi:predicted DNA-binding transcriptional regulator YafY
MKDQDKYLQARRILNTYRLFLKKKQLTASEVIKVIEKDFPSDKRTHQRDLQILAEEQFIELLSKGRNSEWKLLNNRENKIEKATLTDSQVLSFHILKTYLKSFHGTTIEKDINNISSLIENLAPGYNTMEESFFGDQSFGSYDYSEKHEIIRQLVWHINEKNWIHITYSRNMDETVHQYDLFPYFLFTYYGTIYLIAYHPKLQQPANFVLQNIKDIKKIETDVNIEAPKFSYEKFRNNRFAVFGGDVKFIKILIKKDFVKFFENRNWHPSQKFDDAGNGELFLSMRVPITYEFISWICWWGDGIKVLSPTELIDKVKDNLSKALTQYL